MELKNIDAEKIKPFAKQPREHFDREKIAELAESIKTSGLIQPLVVREKGKGYEIIAGERRLRALNEAGEKKVPSIVRNVDEIKAMELSLIENWHREDLSSVERENMVAALWETGKYKTKEELAKRLGAGRRRVNQLISAKEFRNRVPINEDISEHTIRSTAGLEDEERKEVLEMVESGELSPKRVPEEVRLRKLDKGITKVKPEKKKPELKDFISLFQTEFVNAQGSIQRLETGLKGFANFDLQYNFTQDDLNKLDNMLEILQTALESIQSELEVVRDKIGEVR